jgi:hypothetical protein
MTTRALISPENSWLRNAFGILAAAIIIPLAVLVKVIAWPFEKPVERSAEEVADYLRAFIDGTGDEWDWDEFTHCPIDNPDLEMIRGRALAVNLPADEAGVRELKALLHEVEALAGKSN